MRQWHLEESLDTGFGDWFYLLLGIGFLFFISSAIYRKYPKIAPIFGIFLFGYATYRVSQQYFVSITGIIGFALLTIFSVFVFYTDINDNQEKEKIN